MIKVPGPDANVEVVTNNTDFGHAMLRDHLHQGAADRDISSG